MTPRVGRTRPSLTPAARVRFQSYDGYLAEHEPSLTQQLNVPAGMAMISGGLSVDIGAGVRRSYSVELRFPALDAFRAPEVWDRGGHFPPDSERHVEDHGPQGWRWCLWLPEAPEVDFADPQPLGPFLAKVRGFITKQQIYEDRIRQGVPKAQAWPGAAWAHGPEGHVQWLDEQLGPLDPAALRGLLPYLRGNRLPYNKRCPCGTGKKAGLCHKAAVERIQEALHVEEVRRVVEELDRGPSRRAIGPGGRRG